jgi:hypothetical protein
MERIMNNRQKEIENYQPPLTREQRKLKRINITARIDAECESGQRRENRETLR